MNKDDTQKTAVEIASEEATLRDQIYVLSQQLAEMRRNHPETPAEQAEFLRLQKEFHTLYEHYNREYSSVLERDILSCSSTETPPPKDRKPLKIVLTALLLLFSSLSVGNYFHTQSGSGSSRVIVWEGEGSTYGNGYLITDEEPSSSENSVTLKADARVPNLTQLELIDQTPHRCSYRWTAIDGVTELSWNPQLYEETYQAYRDAGRYMESHDFYRYCTDRNNRTLIEELTSTLRSMGEGMGYSDWELVMETANFVQSIPFVTDMESTGQEEWPKYVIETIYDECGDCEDKAILLTSLLNELGYSALLVVFDGHTGVGIACDDVSEGTCFQQGDLSYYYIETSYPDWGIGVLPSSLNGKQSYLVQL